MSEPLTQEYITVTYRKNCDCVGATSSGPRVIFKTEREGDSIRLTATYVYHACDVCDTPWIRTKGRKHSSMVGKT